MDEQRRTIIAECSEKVLHHELLAAQAEQDRKILQEELLRQQRDFREVHQQDLMKHLELQKFQNSASDEFTQKKFIEDQKTIMVVRITVFCSAIVIDVIVHCHTAGALLSQTAENNCPYHRVVGF